MLRYKKQRCTTVWTTKVVFEKEISKHKGYRNYNQVGKWENMVTIKEYAKSKNVSYEAVRKQIQKYKDKELKEHVIRKNKTQYLDDYAVEFLDNRRRESPIMVVQMNKDEEIERLEMENKALLLKVAELQEALLREKDEVKQLQLEKIELLEQKKEEEPPKKSWWKLWNREQQKGNT